MVKLKYLLIVTVLAGAAGCGSSEDHQIQEMDPVAVTVGVATTSPASQVVHVSGRIEAVSSANVSTRMMGNVASVRVSAGERVKKGDLLLVISSADLIAKKAQVVASISQAKSALENAEKDHARFKALYEKGSASEKELENMTTRYEMAKAGLAAAQQMEREVEAQFAYTNLRAPFSGVVTNTFVKEGDMANPGMPLATVEGVSAYEAVVMVPESEITNIEKGAKASVLVKSKDLAIDGVVREVSLSAKNTGGQFLVKIELDGVEGILPGMFVNASISTEGSMARSTSPLVPQGALIRNGQLSGVYTLGNENTAILRWVRTGKVIDGNVEILSGISEGEKYIMRPEGKLFNGAKVLANNLK